MPRPQPQHPMTHVSVKVRADGLAALDARAAEVGATRTEVIRDALALWVAQTNTPGSRAAAVARITARRATGATSERREPGQPA